MCVPYLKSLEAAFRERNPSLAASLRPGLSPEKITRGLKRAQAAGNLEPVVALFSWKDGFEPDVGVSMKLFPRFLVTGTARASCVTGSHLGTRSLQTGLPTADSAISAKAWMGESFQYSIMNRKKPPRGVESTTALG